MDIKIYTSATLGKQGLLTSTFGTPQKFPDSSAGKDSGFKAVDISSIPG